MVKSKKLVVVESLKDPTYILIDASYFIFYRYYALIAWWKLAKPEEPLDNPFESDEFVEKFKKTFIDKIKEIPKKLKIKEFIIIAAQDCPRKDIWRNSLFTDYKATRVYEDDFCGGPFFQIGIDILKQLEIKTLYHPRLEADDCIAIKTKQLLEINPECNIIIVANDMDYLQLASAQVKLINLKYKYLTDNKKWSGDPKKDLFCKIVMGDKSDNIPSIFKKCGPKTALKCYEDPEYFIERLKNEKANDLYEKKYKRQSYCF